jgi:predicted lipoprotein with Yx(FWY)xxD motif
MAGAIAALPAANAEALMSGLLQVSGVVLVASLLVGGCSSSSSSTGTAVASPAAPGSAATGAGTAAIGTVTTSLGTVLTGPSGLTLYTHAGDGPTSSTCTGGCAAAWPPLTVSAGEMPTVGAGVTGTFGTFTRPDGTTQVTYDGLPLYYWTKDTKPGDITGQGVGGFVVALATGGAPAPSGSGTYTY